MAKCGSSQPYMRCMGCNAAFQKADNRQHLPGHSAADVHTYSLLLQEICDNMLLLVTAVLETGPWHACLLANVQIVTHPELVSAVEAGSHAALNQSYPDG